MLPDRRRTTRQLALVLDTVQRSGTEHPTADRVFERVRQVLPHISLGTVYRNLQRLAGERRIGVTFEGRVGRYDPTPTRHDHFLCESCGRIDDLDPTPVDAALAAAGRAGHAATSHTVVVYGRCRDCRRRGDA